MKDFMKPKAAFLFRYAVFHRCTDTAMCRLPGGTTFRRAGCLPRTLCEKTHDAAMRSNPRGAFLEEMSAAGIGKL